MYETILIPTDGSDESARAVEHGIGLAKAFGSTVHALYVIETRAHYVFTVAGHDPAEIDAARAHGEQVVNEIVEAAVDEGIDGVGAVATGSVAEEIIDYATETGVDGIVMGALGRSGVNRYLLGSTTEKVIRTADVPVTVVR